MILLMAFCNHSGFTEGVRYYSFHSLPLEVEVKRSISYVFSFHNQREYMSKGCQSQPLKKIILPLDTGERCDIINAVVNMLPQSRGGQTVRRFSAKEQLTVRFRPSRPFKKIIFKG